MPDYEQLRHEREQIDAGARALRSRAISDGYAGLERKAVAFSFALVLDECALTPRATKVGESDGEIYQASVQCPDFSCDDAPSRPPLCRTASTKGRAVALSPGQAIRLARALRELRESEWPEAELTQAQLAKGLSAESRVAPATLSSWESVSNPKTPTASRLSAYARFFATRRSLDTSPPHLIPENELNPDERERFHELEEQLLGLLQADAPGARSTFSFDEGPITIICPAAPQEERGPLADQSNPNYNRLQQFADLDGLLEMWGHIRAENPQLEVKIRLPSEVTADDFSVHVVLLGGIAWNRVTRRFQAAIGQAPIRQENDPKLLTGDIFVVKGEEGEQKFEPTWGDLPDGGRELTEDVAMIARLRNPFQSSRTLSICNGIHSRGVLGAVRCLTDKSLRDSNERYLAEHFPDGHFALLLRIPVVADETLTPDLRITNVRLYEWTAEDGTRT